MARARTLPRRRGATLIVEFTFVAIIFFMFLFGVIEYARLIFTQQVMLNAAREGARFAVVNSTDNNLVADTQNTVLQRMAGVNNSVKNYTCQVYAADSSGNNIGSATTVQFGQLIGVQIDCD